MEPNGDLDGFIEDLEQQAEGLALAERDAELVDRAQAEYAQVPLAARVHASRGLTVTLSLQGDGAVTGRLTRAGLDWCLLTTVGARQEWVVRLAALLGADGLSERATAEAARPVTARLGFGSAVRGLVGDGGTLTLHLVDGSRPGVEVRRVGADFVETVTSADPTAATRLVPFAAIAAVSSGP